MTAQSPIGIKFGEQRATAALLAVFVFVKERWLISSLGLISPMGLAKLIRTRIRPFCRDDIVRIHLEALRMNCKLSSETESQGIVASSSEILAGTIP